MKLLLKQWLSFLIICIFLGITWNANAQEENPIPPATEVEITPEVQPSSSPTPEESSATSPNSTPTPAPSPTPLLPKQEPPTQEEIINNLSVADMQEALNLLKANYLHPERLNETELNRALLEGIIDRLAPGVLLLPSEEVANTETEAFPFLAEILDERIGYIRFGSLSKENLEQIDSTLDQFATKKIASVVLDLRATPMSNDLESAVEVIKRFVPKGRLLFTIRKPSEKQERIFTSNQDPKFSGLLMILVDHDTAGAAEIVASAVRTGTKSMIIGEQTAGKAVEYEDRKLKGGQILRLAIAEVVIDASNPIFPKGVTPDLIVELSPKQRDEIFQLSKEKGVSTFVFDKERPRLNEAALVAGTDPVLDAYQAELKEEPTTVRPKDTVLQRAIDLITTISIYEKK